MALFDDVKNWLHEAFPFSPEQASGRSQPNEKLMDLSRLAGELTDRYFQVEVVGAENVPAEGGVLLVSNHGFLMVESFVLHNVVLRHTGRKLRPVAAHLAWDIPLFNHFVAAAGGVRGSQDSVVELLEQGELVLIYPGGVREAAKGARTREKLMWEGRTGFVKAALRAGSPVVPVGIAGADDVYIRLDKRIPWVGKLLGDKDASIPLFVGLGPFPLPAPLTFRFGAPISMEHVAASARDETVVQEYHDRIRTAVEKLLEQAD